MDFGEVTAMKQITNKEYEEWQKYKAEKAKGHTMMPLRGPAAILIRRICRGRCGKK